MGDFLFQLFGTLSAFLFSLGEGTASSILGLIGYIFGMF